MAIHSHAFGRVTLTDEDAKKFQNQVRYGRPKGSAKAAVASGAAAVKEYTEKGSVRFVVKMKAK